MKYDYKMNKKDIVLKIKSKHLYNWRTKLFVIIMRFAVWVSGFGRLDMEICYEPAIDNR